MDTTASHIPFFSHIITTNCLAPARLIVAGFLSHSARILLIPPLCFILYMDRLLPIFSSQSHCCVFRFQETRRGPGQSLLPKRRRIGTRPEDVKRSSGTSMPEIRQTVGRGREDEWGQTRPAGEVDDRFRSQIRNRLESCHRFRRPWPISRGHSRKTKPQGKCHFRASRPPKSCTSPLPYTSPIRQQLRSRGPVHTFRTRPLGEALNPVRTRNKHLA
jgi:hypothetical protein